jgi:hypothetical protein
MPLKLAINDVVRFASLIPTTAAMLLVLAEYSLLWFMK